MSHLIDELMLEYIYLHFYTCRDYSGACFKTPEEREAEGSDLMDEIRPDTPEPEILPVDVDAIEEMEAQLLETARQASLQARFHELIVLRQARIDNAADPDAEPEDEFDEVPSRSSTPPPVELNEQGRFTARSKGKGRAT